MSFCFNVAIPLSIDHKPDRSDERQRIEKAGGFIIWAGKFLPVGLYCHFFGRGQWGAILHNKLIINK